MLKMIATGLLVFGVVAITVLNGVAVHKREENIGSARVDLIEKYRVSPSAARLELVSAVSHCVPEEITGKVPSYVSDLLVDSIESGVIFLGANDIESSSDPRAVKFIEQSKKLVASKSLNVAGRLSNELADVQKRSEKLVDILNDDHEKFDRCVFHELWRMSIPKD